MEHKMQATRRIQSRDDKVFDAVVHAILIILSLFFLLPFLNVLSLSISESQHVVRGDVYFWPNGLSFEAYREMLDSMDIVRAFLNSVFLAAVGCILSVLFTAIAAYPLVFSNAPGKKAYSIMIMITYWFSGGMVPTFVVMSQYGLVDSQWSLILLSLISAYNVLVVRAFYQSIPMSLVEAARIDGGNEIWILFRLILPLAKPVLATVAMWVIVGHWNDYLNASIYLKSSDKYTLQLVLRGMLAERAMNAESAADEWQNLGLGSQLKYATVVISMIPMLCIYPFFQRYFVKGIMIGAVK